MDALIIGGGIAGPVAAMALQRMGIAAVVFEARERLDPEAGSYLTITANGLEALASLGSLHLAVEAGLPTRRNVLWNERGRRLARLTLESGLPGSPPARTLKRSRLAAALNEEARRRGIRIEMDSRLKAVEVPPDGRAVAVFADGRRASGDMLVGADGVHSVVRHIIDPAAPDGRYVGLVNFGGLTRGAAAGIEPEACADELGGRAGIVAEALDELQLPGRRARGGALGGRGPRTGHVGEPDDVAGRRGLVAEEGLTTEDEMRRRAGAGRRRHP